MEVPVQNEGESIRPAGYSLTSVLVVISILFLISLFFLDPVNFVSRTITRFKLPPQTITEDELPVDLAILKNHLVYQWAGSVEGKLVAKDIRSITLAKNGYSLKIPIEKMKSLEAKGTRFYKLMADRPPSLITLDGIPIGSFLGGIVLISTEDKNSFFGEYFETREQVGSNSLIWMPKSQRAVEKQPAISEEALPIGIDLLKNPMIYEWRGSVKGTLLTNEREEFVIGDAVGNTLSISLLSPVDGKSYVTFFYEGTNEEVSLNAVALGATLQGEFFVVPSTSRDLVFGNVFRVTK